MFRLIYMSSFNDGHLVYQDFLVHGSTVLKCDDDEALADNLPLSVMVESVLGVCRACTSGHVVAVTTTTVPSTGTPNIIVPRR